MAIRPAWRVFDISYLLIPIGTRKTYFSWVEKGTTFKQVFLEVFIFGVRVARLQIET